MLWKVPIAIATKGNPQAASLMLTEQSVTVTLEGVGESDWVLVREGGREGGAGVHSLAVLWWWKFRVRRWSLFHVVY